MNDLKEEGVNFINNKNKQIHYALHLIGCNIERKNGKEKLISYIDYLRTN